MIPIHIYPITWMSNYNNVTVTIMRLLQSCDCSTHETVTIMWLFWSWDLQSRDCYHHETVTILWLFQSWNCAILWLFQSWDCYNHVTVPIMILLQLYDCYHHETVTIMWLFQSWDCYNYVPAPIMRQLQSCDCSNHETFPGRSLFQFFLVDFPIIILFSIMRLFQKDTLPIVGMFQSWFCFNHVPMTLFQLWDCFNHELF